MARAGPNKIVFLPDPVRYLSQMEPKIRVSIS